MASVATVNLGSPEPNPYKETRATGIGKRPQDGPIEVRAPGPKAGGLGSGLVGDFVGDRKHHGGDFQAVYAFAREDLDTWETRLGRTLPNGFFGENLTTSGIDVNACLLGERWRVGADVVLRVTSPRIPCSTFRGRMEERGWLKTFTVDGRPGAYLQVVEPGFVSAGDPVAVVHRPDHDVTVALTFRALTTDRERLLDLEPARAELEPELVEALDQAREERTGQARRSAIRS